MQYALPVAQNFPARSTFGIGAAGPMNQMDRSSDARRRVGWPGEGFFWVVTEHF